jgi:hypothetical protein
LSFFKSVSNNYKSINFLRCAGKKTALLQAEASACVSGLANVQFCAWAVHYIVFLTAKLPLSFLFLGLLLTFYLRNYQLKNIRKWNAFKLVSF